MHLSLARLASRTIDSKSLADTAISVLWPGMQPDGSMLLPNQWSLRPAGTPIPLAHLPVNLSRCRQTASSPPSCTAGYSANSDHHCGLGRAKNHSRTTPVNEAFYGLAFSSVTGKNLLQRRERSELVHVFRFNRGQIAPLKDIRLRPDLETGVPSGLAVDRDDQTLYVANLWNSRLSRVSLKDGAVQDIELSSNAAPVLPRAPNQSFDAAARQQNAPAPAEYWPRRTTLNGVLPYA